VPSDLLVVVCIAYVALLFAVAFAAERLTRGAGGPVSRWLRSPLVYTLSLSVYCTAWTFYGAVGYAARSGLEFLTIYLGPTLVFLAWWMILRRLVRIARAQRITSIADLVSSRFGKSPLVGVIVTLICVTAATPYIALQLQSVSLSFAAFASDGPAGWNLGQPTQTALWVAAGLALFTILFGTRNLDANEQHPGVVTAIAVEAVVKLVALLAVGVFVVWGLSGGVGATLAGIAASPVATWDLQPGRWTGLIFCAAAAILTLPRMFQVLVVENADERHLAVASWAFPGYLFLMSLFVVPIAVAGLERLPADTNPDLFVLALPLAEGQGGLAMFAFLGGFSAATSMVIVETIALATMLSNHVVMPLWLALGRRTERAGDLRRLVLVSRRAAIGTVMALGYGYYALTAGTAGLAAIGLIAFVGVTQILPAMLGGLFWRGATRAGAVAGLVIGFALWLWTLYLPSFGAGAVLPQAVFEHGPFGLGWLRPRALFGIEGMDPLMHALLWSLLANAGAFVAVSLLTDPGPMERLQAEAFVGVFAARGGAPGWTADAGAAAEDLLVMAQRILGEDAALAFFREAAAAQGKAGWLPDITPGFLDALERRLSGAVGAATAHAMLVQSTGGASVSVEDLLAVASETAQIREYSARLEAREAELTRTARQLHEANDKLTRLAEQKDAFLSQISHELRTPMTSIRAFSEILRDGDLPPETAMRYAGIIHDEAIRLTRLLDDLLDLSVLENGTVQLAIRSAPLADLIDRALIAAAATRPERRFVIQREPEQEALVITSDLDRLAQVLINVISNARKYCDAAEPVLRIVVRRQGGMVTVDVIDNGSGIPAESQALIFEKFARLTDQTRAGGAGLGLAICREIMQNLGGSIAYLPGRGGAAFRLTFPQMLVLDRPGPAGESPARVA
jgi:Na+/proline symporter/signal transduction histidine kinase